MWASVRSKMKSHKLQRGAAALEFALVFPVLLLLLVGMVDCGLLMSTQAVVANAAREGARTAALSNDGVAGAKAVATAIAGLPNAKDAGTTVKVDCFDVSDKPCVLSDSKPDTGGTVIVTVNYPHSWVSPVILGFSRTITLRAQSSMRIE